MPLSFHSIGNDLVKAKAEGCELAYPPELFKGLMIATMGDPCTTGCAYFNKGTCKAYLKYHTTSIDSVRRLKIEQAKAHTDQSGLIGGQWYGMTMKQIAAKEGISLNQARTRKLEGRYK